MSPRPPQPEDRVVVYMSADHPELWADLATLPRRARAARLRHLAAVGLAAIHGGGITVPLATGVAPTPDEVDTRRRDRLVGRLGRVDE